MKIKPDLRANSEDVFRLLRDSVPVPSVIDGAEVDKKVRCVSHDHDDQKPSMHVYDDHVHCYSCGFRGDVVKVWSILHGFDKQTDAARDLARAFNVALPGEAGGSTNGSVGGSAGGSARKNKPREEKAYTTKQVYSRPVYEFRNLAGEVVYVQRHKGAYYRPAGEDRWITGPGVLDGVTRVPYNLPELVEGVGAGRTIFHVEGCKDADTATERLGVTATTTGGVKTWRSEYRVFYRGTDVVILPDNDPEGEEYARKVAADIAGVARSVKVVRLPGLPEKGDLTDFMEAGSTPEQVFDAVEAAPHYRAEDADDVSSVSNVNDSRGSQDLKDATDVADGGKEAEVGITKLLADAICRENYFALDAGGKMYRYSDGAYRKDASKYVRRRVKELLEEWDDTAKWSSYRADEVCKYIAADAPELWEKPDGDWINFQNVILNVVTGEQRDHHPGYLSPVQIPVKYDPLATCPNWEKYVEPCFPDDSPTTPYEIVASVSTAYRETQKAILLSGEGSNGKSTFLATLVRLLGRANCVSVTLQALESNRFATARLVGKLANICPDLPSTHLQETSVFKALTGDEGQITAEYKHKDSFEFEPFCQLVFSANHPPRSSDASHAFFRRWVVVPFEKTFEGDEAIPREELDALLTDPAELSGVLNKALEVLPKLRKRGFTESAKMRDAWEEFRRTTDPVTSWLDRNTIRNPNAYVFKRDLLQKYNAWAESKGRATMTGKAFGSAIKRALGYVEEKQRGPDKQWAWIGIGFAFDTPPPMPSPGPGVSHDSRDSRDYSTCNEKASASDRGDRGEGGNGDLCNRGDRVNRVNPVHAPGLLDDEGTA